MKKFLKNYEMKYRAEIGATVKGSDGKKHKIENEVVAAHPNNKGMKCIADAVIEYIELDEE